MTDKGWRVALYVNEYGSVVHAPGPGINVVAVMPVSEAEAKTWDMHQRALHAEEALQRIVTIGSGPFDREMHPADRWLPALNTCVEIATEALADRTHLADYRPNL